MMPEWKQLGMARRSSPPEHPTGLFFAREFRGLSQDDLVKASGESKAQISKLEHGKRKLTRAWAERFASALAMPAERILFWDKFGPPEDAEHLSSEHVAAAMQTQTPPRMAKLKGYVGAGAQAHFYALADEDYEEVPAPVGASDQTVAVEIKGSSFGPLMDTWLVFYDDVRSPVTDDLIGHVCVVGLDDDRILIKKIQRNSKNGFTLLSNANEPPIDNVRIEWAAKVTDMRPRR